MKSFFKPKDENPDHWKEKYLELLDSQERSAKDYQANEDLLCKTIVRFALAVKGLNKTLDPHFDRIRNLLKSGLQSQQLQRELQAFSNALVALEEAPANSQLDASLLFDFLLSQYPGRQAELDQIHARYDRREFINHQRLLLSLAELINDKKQGQNDFAAELAVADNKAIALQLMQLLDNAEVPDLFSEEVTQLKVRLQSGQALGPVFDDTIALLLAVKKQSEIEQQEIADFLATLTEQLAEIGLTAAGFNMAQEDAQKKRNSLDHDLTSQMADLQKKSASATQLEPLKQLVSIRLAGISQQIQAHNLHEQAEREKTQRELRGLTQKIREMEAESADLHSRLDVAQHRATRDPLTNLPNRLAFDTRLADEIARCKRHGTPLTMAVWDIDFFKKINDSYGHKSGDKALIIIAKLLTKHCRESDFVARIGGEEFVMLLPGTEAQSALNVTEKLRKTVEKSGFNANGDRVTITLSCGISEYIQGDSHESLFERADSGLYKAKQGGRNQCVVV